MKRCSKCKIEKPWSEYHKKVDGFSPYCKVCVSAQRKAFYQANRERLLARQKVYRQANPGKGTARVKAWREANPGWRDGRYRNPATRLHENIGTRIRESLTFDRRTFGKWREVLGYTWEDLKEHLEKLWQPGMSWENYGDWHIDHIRPLSWFNVEGVDCPEFKKCWALENLQPMWAKDNISKGNRWEG